MTAGTKTNGREERLATRLHFAAIHLLRSLRAADEGSELSTAQLSAIATLVNRGEMTMSELAAAEQVRPPTMTRLVQSLEASGHVLREPSENDARVSRVRHATRGWVALQEAAADRTKGLARRLADLDKSEIATLEGAVALLEQMVARPASRERQ